MALAIQFRLTENPSSPNVCQIIPLQILWGSARRGEETQVNATILFVGEERFLSKTRAQILRGLKTVIADSMDAPQEIHARAYDLVIFCHTIPDSVAKEIIASATRLHPGIKFLAIDEG
jgi:hypothetical protein